MDTTQTITHLGLCAGYGGIELGLKRIFHALRTVALCEIEGFAIANLVAKMEAGLLDAAPIWSDLKTFPWKEFSGKVDIITGGYPCQPFSAAGNRLGKDDPRHLWPFIADGVRLLQPRICFFENVDGHISLGLREVVEELEGLGYKTTWGIFSASEVGAPHQRKRVFIMAYRNDSGLEGCLSTRVLDSFGREESSNGHFGSSRDNGSKLADTSHSRRRENWLSAEFWSSVSQQSSGDCWVTNALARQQVWPSRPGEAQYGWEPPRVVGNAESRQDYGREPRDLGKASGTGRCGDYAADCTSQVLGDTNSERSQERTGARGAGLQGTHADGGADTERQTEPPLGGDVNGTPSGMDYAELCISCDNRTDELRLLGNGVVPSTAERAFLILANQLDLL